MATQLGLAVCVVFVFCFYNDSVSTHDSEPTHLLSFGGGVVTNRDSDLVLGSKDFPPFLGEPGSMDPMRIKALDGLLKGKLSSTLEEITGLTLALHRI